MNELQTIRFVVPAKRRKVNDAKVSIYKEYIATSYKEYCVVDRSRFAGIRWLVMWLEHVEPDKMLLRFSKRLTSDEVESWLKIIKVSTSYRVVASHEERRYSMARL